MPYSLEALRSEVVVEKGNQMLAMRCANIMGLFNDCNSTHDVSKFAHMTRVPPKKEVTQNGEGSYIT